MLAAMLRRCCFLLAFAVVFAAIGEGQGDGDLSGKKAQQIDAVISRYTAYGYLNGAVLVADRGRVIYRKGVGYANIATRAINTAETKFGIASLTKQFTAVLALQQAAEGNLRLDARLSDYLPWYRKDTGARITIEQLLHHTSGLPADFNSPEFSDSEPARVRCEPQEFAQRLCQPDLTSTPGTKWEYSNCGYDLLGLVLERATGRSFDTLLSAHLLAPLGMKNTGMNHNNLVQLGGAQGYARKAGPRFVPGPQLDMEHIFAAGAMYSSVDDLYLWNQALSDGGWIAKDIREQVFAPGLNNWGYGWFVSKIPQYQPGAGGSLAEMRGDMPGNYFSWILRYPERNAVVIVLRNGYGSTERLEQNLQAILFDQPPHMPSRGIKDVAAQFWLVPAAWGDSHRVLSMICLVALAFAIWAIRYARRKRQILASEKSASD